MTENVFANVQELELPEHGDARGRLIPLEAGSGDVPFEVKRAYFHLRYDTWHCSGQPRA